MQQIQIIGNLGEDATIREFNSSKFVSFRVACTEKVRQNNEMVPVTTWYSCSMNRVPTELMQYLVKGAKVFVQGLPTYHIYDSAVYRCKMIDVRVFVDSIRLCGSRQVNDEQQQQQTEEEETF